MELDRLFAPCPGCGEATFRRRRGEWTLASRILKVAEDGSVTGVCVRCGEPVPVPFLRVVEPERTRRLRAIVRRKVVDSSDETV
jgi:hypothetical protein